MHDDGDEQVEEGRRHVLEARRVEHDVGGLALGADLDGHGHVVVQRDEERRRRRRHLEHEPHHEHHGHARHDVRVVLDHELVAQDRRVLVGGAALHGHGGGGSVAVPVVGAWEGLDAAGEDGDGDVGTLGTDVCRSYGASATARASLPLADRRC